MLDEYRQRFRAFHTHWQREQFLHLTGRKTPSETTFLLRENSDLFTASKLAELQTQHDETAEYRKTERLAIQRLLAFARAGQLALRTLELTGEIADYETQATFTWNEHPLTINQAQSLIAQEANPGRRRELQARRADLVEQIQDLRLERVAKLQQGAQALGYDNYLLLQQLAQPCEFEKLLTAAAHFLTKTESAFVNQLRPLLARFADASLDEASPADLSFAQRLSRFAPYFAGERWREIYADLFAGLGFKVAQQSQVEIDDVPRSGKQSRSCCTPVQVPEEVKLVLNPEAALSGGHLFYQNLLQTAGQTQLYAWTSRESLYEFRVPGDPALAEAWGTLFRNLLMDASFLAVTFAFPESGEFRHALAVFRLLQVRRAAALLQYETELYADKLGLQAGARFAELLTDATRLHHSEAEHLRAVEPAFRSAACLRAWAFEAQLREFLKTRYGLRWWTSRQAGDLVIDLWNTGHRYPVEELAVQVGLGALDFEWLANELLETVTN